jgi:hypothetical protein
MPEVTPPTLAMEKGNGRPSLTRFAIIDFCICKLGLLSVGWKLPI